MHPYVSLAKHAIKSFVEKGAIIVEENPENIRAGCFVSIHKTYSDELRGCIGTILPTCKNLSTEIINNAISACRDSRFEPIAQDELDDLDISVDILSEPEPITSPKSLDVKKYGVIVKSKDGRTGLLLPDLEGIDDPMYQVAIARKKAGIKSDEPIYLYRFTVDRYR